MVEKSPKPLRKPHANSRRAKARTGSCPVNAFARDQFEVAVQSPVILGRDGLGVVSSGGSVFLCGSLNFGSDFRPIAWARAIYKTSNNQPRLVDASLGLFQSGEGRPPGDFTLLWARMAPWRPPPSFCAT